MKISPDQLPGRLARGLAPVYLVAGDEPLLVMEACDAIRGTARAAGFSERELIVAERGYNWTALEGRSANLSLFAAKRILEIRLPTGKPGSEGAAALARLAEGGLDDTLLLVVTPKLEGGARLPAWAKSLDRAGAFIQVWPVDASRLPRWIDTRMRARGLHPAREAVELLAERVEGNLLAADQEIEKLLLLAGPGAVDVDAVRRVVADSARFDVWQLVDAALIGEAARALRILEGLRAEGVEPVFILWALVRELRALATAASEMKTGRTAEQAVAAARVWPKRRSLVRQALMRHDAASASALVSSSAHADQVLKGCRPGLSWEQLSRLVAGLSTASLAQPRRGRAA
ncbi:DNA polymerase III subunit delta [soil metagenome]